MICGRGGLCGLLKMNRMIKDVQRLWMRWPASFEVVCGLMKEEQKVRKALGVGGYISKELPFAQVKS